LRVLDLPATAPTLTVISRSTTLPAGLTLAVILTGCTSDQDSSAPLDTMEQRASYFIGRGVGEQMEGADGLDVPAFTRGFADQLGAVDSPLPQGELIAAYRSFQARADSVAESRAAAEMQAGSTYREQNAFRSEVSVTASGLQYEVIEEGDGASPTEDGSVLVHYTGTLIDGTEFDSSRNGDPAQFRVGGLISGFTEALMLMREGGRLRVVIPPELGYGVSGSGSLIGPGATLIFDIELIEVID